jgi:hypothetical protein
MKGCAIKANLLKSVGVLLLFAGIIKIVMLVVNQKKEDKKKDKKDKKDKQDKTNKKDKTNKTNKKGNVLSKLGIAGSPNGISYSNCGLK